MQTLNAIYVRTDKNNLYVLPETCHLKKNVKEKGVN